MTDLEEKAKEYFVKDCVEYDEDEYICENFEKAIKDAYKKGYEQAEKNLIVQLADFLHISLTFKNPVEVFEEIMEKK